ncbi:nucleotidyltransferase family protein [Vibrio brasiliensis]|uniref:nucleotidyltransferase family protein n=1 Tax=Vibrio brasiliensis TaxID=170652 RepID=UPI001EFD464E|nr:nucleotidyltransferase family protein [Vibrio brasiliensis]MCG9647715.1 nucleotidyltransferase family protein [Vibrio brasiliensis]
MNKIIELVTQDTLRVSALQCAAKLDLPDWYLAAGFVRNLVWDQLHALPEPTPLNDVDMIYFDPSEKDDEIYLTYEQQLTKMMPELNWQVRNQAKMHLRNGDRAYTSSLDAMSYWPEKETAVGIRLNQGQDYQCVAAFGYQSLFELKVTHNPKRGKSVFDQRVATKGWLQRWPKLTLASD